MIKPYTLKSQTTPSLNCEGCGSHLCELIPMDLPSPASHIDPSQITSQVCSRLFQTKEGFEPNSASINEQWGKYLALYTWWNNECVSLISRHAYLASMAKLNSCIFRKPIPSFFFKPHSLPQLIQCIFFSFQVCPHQYLDRIELIPSQIVLGILNKLME